MANQTDDPYNIYLDISQWPAIPDIANSLLIGNKNVVEAGEEAEEGSARSRFLACRGRFLGDRLAQASASTKTMTCTASTHAIHRARTSGLLLIGSEQT